jgi:hypothetical protein
MDRYAQNVLVGPVGFTGIPPLGETPIPRTARRVGRGMVGEQGPPHKLIGASRRLA